MSSAEMDGIANPVANAEADAGACVSVCANYCNSVGNSSDLCDIFLYLILHMRV